MPPDRVTIREKVPDGQGGYIIYETLYVDHIVVSRTPIGYEPAKYPKPIPTRKR